MKKSLELHGITAEAEEAQVLWKKGEEAAEELHVMDEQEWEEHSLKNSMQS